MLFSIERKSFGQFLKHTSRFQFGRLHSLTHLTLKLNIDDNSAVTVFIEIFLILRFAKLPYFANFSFFQTRWSPIKLFPCISFSPLPHFMEAGNVRVPLARSNCLSAAFFDGKLGQWPNTLVLYNDIYSIVQSIVYTSIIL